MKPSSAARSEHIQVAVTNTEEAVTLCRQLSVVMDALIETVERETDLVKAGHLMEAGELAPHKARLSEEYTGKMLRLKRNTAAMKEFAPEEMDQLQRKHNLFRALLKINLGALGAAREVSSEIMETLAAAVGKTRQPSGYGANARMPKSSAFLSQGVALDRGI